MSARTSPAAVRSLSRRLLLRLIELRPDLEQWLAASDVALSETGLREYQTGERLMPFEMQERLAAFALIHEPRLSRLAHQLQAQVEAARRYEAGDVVRHLTSPRWPK